MNILVIEDHDMQRKLADHVLSAAGHRVVGAADARLAMEAIATDRPDVILLDLALPGADGLSLARLLKSDPAMSDIPLVAITSFPERYTRAAAMFAGCDAYLLKPVSTRALPGIVESAMRKQGPTSP